MKLNRAFALLEIKAADDESRILEGLASTPEADRMGDIVEPKGAEFNLPIPFLWQHDSHCPIGNVIEAKVTKAGILIKAQIAAAGVTEEIDKAWTLIKAKLVRGLSIGFRALDTEDIPNSWGRIFKRWELLEISAVTIAANASATITAIKAISNDELATAGRKALAPVRLLPPGGSGIKPKPKDTKMTTLAEQVTALEATRVAKAAAMSTIMEKSGADNLTLDAAEQEEFDGIEKDIEAIDGNLKRLRTLEKINKQAAKPVAGKSQEEADNSRDARPHVQIMQRPLEKGIGFARYVKALAAAGGNRQEAAMLAKTHWGDSSPDIEAILRIPSDILLKTAINAGTTSDATWAGPLVVYQNLASEFIEYLRPLSIVGRINGFRRVPFKVKVPRQTAGASVNWVGETKIKPLSALAFDSLTFEFYKIAGIIPLSEELVRFSNPSAEALVRDDLAAAIAQLMDSDFLDPTKAEQVGVSPASVTNGVTPVTPTGTTSDAFRTDVKTMFTTMLTANLQISGGVWIMTQGQALALMMMRNALDQDEFPGINVNGGTLFGFPVIVSQNIAATGGSPTDGYPIVFLMPQEIMLADEGGVNIDMSREASLVMDTAPDSPESASTVMVNLWQHNMIAIKAERFMNWKKRRDNAVGFIQLGKYA